MYDMSLISPHINYYRLACGSNCHSANCCKSDLSGHFKSPVAHLEPIRTDMNHLKLADMYAGTIHLLSVANLAALGCVRFCFFNICNA